MWSRNRATLVAGLLILAGAGCSSDASSRQAAPTTSSTTTPSTTTPTSVVARFHKGDAYVSLGSSIASGFGISVQSTTCGRSSRDFGQLIAAHYEVRLTDVSCGAAVIPNVLDTPQGTYPPQIWAVTPNTKLVTVAVGGNDINYNATAITCGDPKTVCRAPAMLDAEVAALPAKLAAMLDRIKAAAPSATIVFVTYPREVPDGNCAALSFTDDEAAVVRQMGMRLEAAFVAAAKRPGVVFVDPYAAPGDHTGCAPSSRRWTAGHVASDGFAYHPTALGHEVMAQMIEKALG
jgi:lysophospholipase L1-like esterase